MANELIERILADWSGLIGDVAVPVLMHPQKALAVHRLALAMPERGKDIVLII